MANYMLNEDLDEFLHGMILYMEEVGSVAHIRAAKHQNRSLLEDQFKAICLSDRQGDPIRIIPAVWDVSHLQAVKFGNTGFNSSDCPHTCPD